MADNSDTTPFLADNDHGDNYDETEHYITKKSPANAHFKLPIKILTIIISVLSFSICGILIGSYVFINTGPFEYTYGSSESVRDLAICLFVTFILTAPTIILQLPILINIAINIAMSIVLFVFSSQMFGYGWPDSNFCRRWNYYPGRPSQPVPENRRCIEGRDVLRILMGISAGFGIILGLLLLTNLLLRVTALTRTRFWEGKKIGGWKGLGWTPTGFTVQFTLKFLPAQEETAVSRAERQAANVSSGEEGRLIET